MRVVEKFRREGDAIFYDVTVEDPEVLVEPLVFPTRIMRRNTGANAGLLREQGHCETDFETESGRHADSALNLPEGLILDRRSFSEGGTCWR